MLELLKSGGPVMYPLALCSIMAVAIVIEKLWNLRASKILGSESFETLVALIEGGRVDKAAEMCRRKPGIFYRIIGSGLDHHRYGRDEVKQAILDAGRQEVPRLSRYLGALGTIASIAPLLGLFGTVTGMIKVFRVIAALGVGHASDLAEGISEALITTASGLPIAIFSLVMYNYFSDQAESIVLEIEKRAIAITRHLFEPEVTNDTGRAAALPPGGEG
jgi:biopolymer transport protein ExbB